MKLLPWFHLHFIENPGMAWGWKFGNETGKIVLTFFDLQLSFSVHGIWAESSKIIIIKGFIVCAALIYAGALGNLIDSMFYGMIFDKGYVFVPALKDYQSYSGVAALSTNGYSSFLHGCVVDMLYFPIFDTTLPKWVPFWGGEQFEFFSPIFNIADASISVGVITLLIFQKRFFKRKKAQETFATIETSADISDKVQVQ